MHITNSLGIGLMILVGCSASPAEDDKRLPGATHTPHLNTTSSNIACGSEIAFYGNPSPDIVYAYTYNAAGQLAHSEGVHAWGGPNHTSDYAYNAAGNLTALVEHNVWGDGELELAATYDANEQLLGYSYSYQSPDWQDDWSVAFSNFVGPHQPAREVATQGGQTYGYDLSYDNWGRLVLVDGDNGETTTYAYDDQALTISMDMNNGAVTGLIAFDADGRPLSESYGGSDPGMKPSESVFAWTGDRLDTITTHYDGELVEVDTFLYNCAAARAGNNRPVRFVRPGSRSR